MLDWVSDPRAWLGLVSLVFIETVLGVDNIVLLTVLSGALQDEQRKKARRYGLLVAAVSRVILLIALVSVVSIVKKPFLFLGPLQLSGKDLILIGGGLFLIAKATTEIHQKMEGEEDGVHAKAPPTFMAVMVQVFVMDIVFSLDSVITALGMTPYLLVQVLGVCLAVFVMLLYVDGLSAFVDRHPTVKMLALAFLVLIGLNLVAEGMKFEIPKAYTYFAMAWSVGVELLNLRFRKKRRLRALGPDTTPDGTSELNPRGSGIKRDRKH